MTQELYQDKNLVTLTVDFCFFISSYYQESKWSPSLKVYDPEISKDQWIEYLKNDDLIKEKDLYVLTAFCSAREPSCYAMDDEFPVNKWGSKPFNLFSASARAIGQRFYKSKVKTLEWRLFLE